MVVTHLFQLMAFVAMEPPSELEPTSISEKKNEVFRSLLPVLPWHVVRGQYQGYRQEEGVARDSDTGIVHRHALRARQLALGRGPVLPPHRKANAGGHADHLDRV